MSTTKKSFSKIASKSAKAVKVTKVNKNPRVEVKAAATKGSVKRAEKAITKVPPSAKITFVSERPNKKTGPKTDVLKLVPRKGVITFSKLQTKAEESDVINPALLGKWIGALARDGRINIA